MTRLKKVVQMVAYITGCSYWDNTPPGFSKISHPVVHHRAGGKVPIRTIAVGHAIKGQNQYLDFPKGTRFYLQRFKKYASVADVCGDEAKPQNGPCHTGYAGFAWLDLYIGGAHQEPEYLGRCASHLMGKQMVIMNPPPKLETVAGEMVASGCRAF